MRFMVTILIKYVNWVRNAARSLPFVLSGREAEGSKLDADGGQFGTPFDTFFAASQPTIAFFLEEPQRYW